jgi:hypothetical protein
MNFQQEEQLAGASPHTWLSSTDKMCTTDNLATSSISAPVSIVMGGSGVFLFAGPAEDEFTCYSRDLQHLNILQILLLTHIGRVVYYCMKVRLMSCHLRVICCQKCTQTNSEAIRFVDICKAKTLLCNYDVHAHIENSLTVLHMCSNWKVGKQEKKLLISVSYKCTALFQIS